MTKKLIAGLAACAVLPLCALAACADDKAPKADPTLELDGSFARIDMRTDVVSAHEGVKALDGNGKDITDRIKLSVDGDGENYSIADGAVVFSACGDYTVRYTVDDGYGKTAVAEKSVQVRNIYSVYLTNATLPPLYGALDMAATEYKFIYFNDREGTVDVSCYGDRVVGDYKNTQADYDAAVQSFKTLYSDDEYSYFRMFIPDARNQMALRVLVREGVDTGRYEIKYLSDGSMSYNASFPYRGEDAFDKWQANVDIYNNMYALAASGAELAYGGVTLGDEFLAYELHDCYIAAAQKENAEFWGAFPEALTSADARVQAEIDNAHLVKKQPEVMYASLTDAQKRLFLTSVSFDKDAFDKEYFAADGKYLIVTGAKSITGGLTSERFIELMRRICGDYAEYNILFKPHPSGIPSNETYPDVYKYMNDSNIKILPGRLPMEVISWVYGDALIGGFDSSLYMSVPQGNAAFFIAKDKDKLSAVSKLLYESGAFGDVAFYWSEGA